MPIAKKSNSPYWWYDVRHAGRRYRGSTKETNKTAARAYEAELLTRLEREGPLLVRSRRAPLLRDFLPQFIASVNANQLRAEKTKKYYELGAKLLDATSLREFPLDKITTSVVAAVKFPHSAYTANNAIRTLSRALSHATELGYLYRAPRLHLHRETPREMTFSPEQEARLLAVAPQPLADVFIILMDTGMRPEEVCRLRWDEVHWDRNVIRVLHGKTRASRREIGISSRVRTHLEQRVKDQSANTKLMNCPWVFPSVRRKNGELTHITTVNKAFAIARKEAGLPKELVLYATRHTFGTDVMEATGNLKLTMKAMGHVDAKTSARYQHPGTGQVAGVIDARNAHRKSVTAENGHTFGHTLPPEVSPYLVNIERSGADERI